MPRVLITDAHYRKSLAAVRSLGRRGFHVEVCEETPICTSRFSRFCRRHHRSPSRFDVDSYIDFLRRQFRRKYDLFLPMEEETCLIVALNPDLIPSETRYLIPSYDQIVLIRDKSNAFAIAKRLGIPTPTTHRVRTAQDLEHLPLPLIIRPRNGTGTMGVEYVETTGEAKAAWEKKDDPLVQEVIQEGAGLAVSILMNRDSEPRAIFTHERIRENPARGGPSTLARSIHRPDVEAWAVKLLKHLNWVGVASVEFRTDASDGVPKFIEVNPRFWGTLQLPIAAGVDFPYLLWKLCRDGDIEPVTEYKKDVYFRWTLPGDAFHFWRNPNRWRDLPKYLDHWTGPNVTHAIFSWDDPAPALGRLLSVPFFLIQDARNNRQRHHR